MREREKVAVIGGGVGGLTAAHELVERGFEVHVFERRQFFGGKAASTRLDVSSAGSGGRPKGHASLPAEHGFRFFPGWYRHLIDTMKRIPYRRTGAATPGETTFDNLVAIDANLMAWFDRPAMPVVLHVPRTFDQVLKAKTFFTELNNLGLEPGEVGFFLSRLAHCILAKGNDRLALQQTTWWDYLEASAKSKAFQDLVKATTRTMIAAKADEANADTMGKLAVRTLFDSLSSVDRVLNGPTSEKWIDPWVDYLRGRGVVFHMGCELSSVEFSGETRTIQRVSFSSVLADQIGRLRRLPRSIAYDFSIVWKKALAAEGGESSSAKTPDADDASESWKVRAARHRLDENCGSALQLADAIDLLVEDRIMQQEKLATRMQRDSSPQHRQAPRAALPPPQRPEDSLRVLKECRQALAFLKQLVRFVQAWRIAEEIKREARSPDVEPPRALLDQLIALCPPSTSVGSARLTDGQEDGRSAYFRATFENSEAVDKCLEQLLLPIPNAILVSLPMPNDNDPRAAALVGRKESWKDCLAVEHALAGAKLPRFLRRDAALDDALRAAQLLPDDASLPEDVGYFVFALPIEQMAYYVHRSTTMRTLAPELQRILELANQTSWMAGVQFYLEEPFEFVRGHMIVMDSEWGLTAIEQTQFWRDVADLPSGLKGVISVDVAAWDRRGRFIQKEGFNCTDDEIAEEVWKQLKEATSVEDQRARLRDDMLMGGKLERNVSYHIDDSIADLFDRKKQGAYERARSVLFSAEATETPSSYETPSVWGPRLRFNIEPLLVNRVGTQALRPEAKTSIRNMFLAADYLKTETDLACMEGANEAARRAVNALLDAAGSKEPRCSLFQFTVPVQLVEQLARVGGGDSGGALAASAMRTVTQAAGELIAATSRVAGLGSRRRER